MTDNTVDYQVFITCAKLTMIQHVFIHVMIQQYCITHICHTHTYIQTNIHTDTKDSLFSKVKTWGVKVQGKGR